MMRTAAVLMVLVAGVACAAERPEGTLRVLSSEARAGESAALAAQLSAADADVVCLQGMPAVEVQRMAAQLGLQAVERNGRAVLARHALADVREVRLQSGIALVARIDQPGAPAGVYAVCGGLPAEVRIELNREGVPPGALIVCGEWVSSPGEPTVRTLVMHPPLPRLPMQRAAR